jgi:hypothetical protein
MSNGSKTLHTFTGEGGMTRAGGMSLETQRSHRINGRCAPGGVETRKRSDGEQQGGDSREHEGIADSGVRGGRDEFAEREA